jgi:putative membrane protein
MAGFLLRALINTLALYLASLLIPNFIVVGGIFQFVLAGILLALLNMLVRPVIKLVSLPLIILTLGLFTVFINAMMLWLVDISFDFVTIQTFSALFWATLVVSAVNILSHNT